MLQYSRSARLLAVILIFQPSSHCFLYYPFTVTAQAVVSTIKVTSLFGRAAYKYFLGPSSDPGTTYSTTSNSTGIIQGDDSLNVPQTAEAITPIIQQALQQTDRQQPVILNINITGQSTKAASNSQQPLKEPTFQPPSPLLVQAQSLWKKYPVLIAAGTVVGTYSCIQAYLWYISFKLSSCNWSGWRQGTPLEELFGLTQSELAKELLRSIELLYADNTTPILLFFKQAEEELRLLKQYQAFTEYLQKTSLSKLFFYNTNLLHSLRDRIQRLQFIKNSFIASLSQKTV